MKSWHRKQKKQKKKFIHGAHNQFLKKHPIKFKDLFLFVHAMNIFQRWNFFSKKYIVNVRHSSQFTFTRLTKKKTP